MTYDKETLIKLLRSNEHIVTFKKKSTGEMRTMRCTLEESKVPGGVTTGFDHGESISVYDLDKKDWRSFIVNSIKSVKAA